MEKEEQSIFTKIQIKNNENLENKKNKEVRNEKEEKKECKTINNQCKVVDELKQVVGFFENHVKKQSQQTQDEKKKIANEKIQDRIENENIKIKNTINSKTQNYREKIQKYRKNIQTYREIIQKSYKSFLEKYGVDELDVRIMCCSIIFLGVILYQYNEEIRNMIEKGIEYMNILYDFIVLFVSVHLLIFISLYKYMNGIKDKSFKYQFEKMMNQNYEKYGRNSIFIYIALHLFFSIIICAKYGMKDKYTPLYFLFGIISGTIFWTI